MILNTAWNVSKYEIFFGPYFPVFGLNTGKYRPEKTLYLDTFHAVEALGKSTAKWKDSAKFYEYEQEIGWSITKLDNKTLFTDNSEKQNCIS